MEESDALESSSSVPQLPQNVVVIKTRNEGPFGPEQTIYLVGTSHVSKQSVEEVRQTIRHAQPQVVMVELCEQRRPMLNKVIKQAKQQTTRQHYQLWKEGKQPLFLVVYAWAMGQVGDKLEVDPGEEFRVAVEEASRVGAAICLGDRLVSITIARTWAALSRWEKIKFIFELLWVGLAVPEKELNSIMAAMHKDTDVVTAAIKDFGQAFPSVMRPLLEERDEYMAYVLRKLASQASKIVAVVGAGHLKGIQEKWDAEIDIQEITRMPMKKQKPERSWAYVVLLASAGTVTVASIALAIHWRRRR